MRGLGLSVFLMLVMSAAACDGGGSGGGPGGPDTVASTDTSADVTSNADGVPTADVAPDAGGADGGADVDVASPQEDAGEEPPDFSGSTWLEGPQGPQGIDIQPSIALGPGGAVALAWTGSSEETGLGIRFALLGPDGAVTAGPLELDTTRKGMRNEPSLCALDGGGYVVAWSVDTKEAGPDGETLQVRFRRVGSDGAPLDAEDQRVYTERPGNHWLAEVACDSGGGFVVGGVRPDSVGTTFGVFIQRYDADGKKVGDAESVNPAPEGDQTFPDLGVAADGTVVVAWDDSLDNVKRVLVRRLPIPPAAPSEVLVGADGGGQGAEKAAISVEPATGTFLVGGIAGGTAVELRYFAAGASEGAPLTLPTAASPAYFPALAAIGSTGQHAVVWYEGTGADVSARVALMSMAGVVAGPLDLVEASKLPPYLPSVAWRSGRLAVAWTESPEAGRYVIGGVVLE